MQAVLRFGECLKQILDSRSLTILEASRLMGLKSPTSLARILHDEVSYKTSARFFQRLLQEAPHPLLPEEINRLEAALAVSRLGTDEFRARQAMWRLLSPQVSPAPETDIRLTLQNTPSLPPLDRLSQLVAVFETCRAANILLLGGSGNLPLALLPLLREKSGREISIAHFLYADEKALYQIVSGVAAIRPLLPSPRYMAYSADRRSLSPESLALYRRSALLCDLTDASGHRHYYHGVLTDSDTMLLTEYQDAAAYAFHTAILQHNRPRLTPVKAIFPADPQPESYIDYTENYRRLKHDQEIYSIKPDVPINFIHPNLLLNVAADSFAERDFWDLNTMKALARRLSDIHLMRFRNFRDKKKVTHIIFSQSAMEEFTRTGIQSDHFFALRPFTPAERIRILSWIREQMLKNPYFNVHFSVDDALPFQTEITCYAQAGVMMTDAHTSY